MKKFFVLILAILSTSVFSQQNYNSLKVKDFTNTNTAVFNTLLNGVAKLNAGVLSASPIVNADVSAGAAISFSKLSGVVDTSTAQNISGNKSFLNNFSVTGTTTLATSLSGYLKATAGVVSSVSQVDLSTDVVGTLPITNGGTGSTSKSWVDLTTNQSGIAGNKTFTGNLLTTGTMLASNLSGTNTGDLTTSGWSGPTTTTSKLKAPFRQMTPSATGEVDIETGNNNELINPRFEASTYNDGWTCSLGTMSQGVGPDGSKALSVVSTGAGFRCRQTFTSSADLKGTLARFYARIKTAAPDVKVCGLDGGILTANEVGCITVKPTTASKVFDDPSNFFTYGNAIYGIVIYTNNTLAFPTIIDDAYMGVAGLTAVSMSNDAGVKTYSPTWTATINPSVGNGAISGAYWLKSGLLSGRINLDFGSTTSSGSGAWIFGIPSGYQIDTSKITIGSPGSLVGSVYSTNGTASIGSVYVQTSTSLYITTSNGSVVSATSPFSWVNGNNLRIVFNDLPLVGVSVDTAGILSSNADTSWAPCTFPTLAWQGLGTVSNGLKCKRLGDSIKIRGYFAAGTATASIAQVPLPNNFGTLTVGSTVDSGTSFGSIFRNVVGADVFYNTVATAGASYFGMSSALINAGSNPSVAAGGTSITGTGNSLIIDGELTIPIAGWTQSPIAIIPLAGTSTTPGYSGQVDDLVFAFGDTSSTPCTTGTCAYLRQAGNGIVKVDFAGTGAYTINTRRSYNLIFCTGSLTGTSYTIGFQGSGAGPGNSFTIQTGGGVVNINSWGTLFCKGYY